MPASKSLNFVNKSRRVECAFCHLSGNPDDNLGDLFGPHYASTLELIKQSAKMEEANITYVDEHVRSMASSEVREIRVDRDKRICYLTVPKTLGVPPYNPEDECRMINSVQAAERKIGNDSINLQFVHTVDYLLPDQKRSNAHQKEEPRVPGFNGKITINGTNDEGQHITINDVSSEELNSALSGTQMIVFVQFKSTDNDKPPIGIQLKNNALWVHAKCVEFAPDVFCIGNKVYGLYDAVHCSSEVYCSVCGLPGATISSAINSEAVYHYPCAKRKGVQGV